MHIAPTSPAITLRRLWVNVAASAGLALALAGCGGGAEPGTEAAAQAPPESSTTGDIARAAPTATDVATPCTQSRAFGLTRIRGESARASANGIGAPYERSQASELWTLEVTATQLEYIAESLAGGCTPVVEFTTEGTTSALNAGKSSYRAKVEVLHNGQPLLRRPVREGESFPMFGCETIVCQRFTDYAFALDQPITVGDLLTVSSSAIAVAIVGGTSSSDQAHADWQLESPLMRVPIP